MRVVQFGSEIGNSPLGGGPTTSTGHRGASQTPIVAPGTRDRVLESKSLVAHPQRSKTIMFAAEISASLTSRPTHASTLTCQRSTRPLWRSFVTGCSSTTCAWCQRSQMSRQRDAMLSPSKATGDCGTTTALRGSSERSLRSGSCLGGGNESRMQSLCVRGRRIRKKSTSVCGSVATTTTALRSAWRGGSARCNAPGCHCPEETQQSANGTSARPLLSESCSTLGPSPRRRLRQRSPHVALSTRLAYRIISVAHHTPATTIGRAQDLGATWNLTPTLFPMAIYAGRRTASAHTTANAAASTVRRTPTPPRVRRAKSLEAIRQRWCRQP
mmetsp:Transcript_14614/g.43266  ORF Transcript_14614/g.43266 Transcript_14614/m.43266 type:complete len:328 (+) Transcript_14614:1846-2829(+)